MWTACLRPLEYLIYKINGDQIINVRNHNNAGNVITWQLTINFKISQVLQPLCITNYNDRKMKYVIMRNGHEIINGKLRYSR